MKMTWGFLMALIMGLVVACAPSATDGELNAMCEKLVDLRADRKIPQEADVVARIDEDYAKKKQHLVDWKAKEMKSWDVEMEAKLVEAQTDEDKKKVEELYAEKKKIGAKQFDDDLIGLDPAKVETLAVEKEKLAARRADRAQEVEVCVKEAKAEGVSQKLAQCRASAESKDKYWNLCK